MEQGSTKAKADSWDEYASIGSNEITHALAKLKAKASKAKTAKQERAPSLPLTRIRRVPELFQPRQQEEDDRHVKELVRALKRAPTLDPLLVMQIGRLFYLLDGHHRWLAYKEAGTQHEVPVEYFEGTVEEAVLAAGRANSKTKLPMTAQERYNFAWKLVLIDEYSKKQIVQAAGVSDGQVAEMRRVCRELGVAAWQCRTWWEAQARANNRPEMTDEERKLWIDRMADLYADKIKKACGPKFRNNGEIAAKAIALHFGRRLEDLVKCLREFLPDDFMRETEE